MHRPLTIVAILVGALAVAVPGLGQSTTGDLLVTCWPGHLVLLDGAPAGVTVSEEDGRYLAAIAAGEHTVRIEKDGFVPREYRVDVPPGGIVELKVEDLEPAAGAILVLADPGRRVYFDGALVGLTTAADGGLLVPAVTLGRHHLRVEKLGRETVETEVDVLGGVTAEVAIGAENEPAAPIAATTEAVAAPAPDPATSVAAPEVLDSASASLPESTAAPETTAAAADFDLQRKAPSAADALFAYRARGAGLAAGGAVTVTRERGGPRAPVMVFWCVDQSECRDQTRPAFAPGAYRFRVNCRAGRAAAAADADAFVELDARSGGSYLIDVVFDDGCSATAVALGE